MLLCLDKNGEEERGERNRVRGKRLEKREKSIVRTWLQAFHITFCIDVGCNLPLIWAPRRLTEAIVPSHWWWWWWGGCKEDMEGVERVGGGLKWTERGG